MHANLTHQRISMAQWFMRSSLAALLLVAQQVLMTSQQAGAREIILRNRAVNVGGRRRQVLQPNTTVIDVPNNASQSADDGTLNLTSPLLNNSLPTPSTPPSTPPPSTPPPSTPPPSTPPPPLSPAEQPQPSPSPPIPPPQPPGPAILPGSICPDTQSLLERKNLYRVLHQAPAFQWNLSLAASAAVYAQQLAGDSCQIKHSSSRSYGENLFSIQAIPKPDNSCSVAVQSWYSEVQFYNFSAAQPFYDNWYQPHQIGHFSQLVWKGSSSVGCGVGLADFAVQISNKNRTMGCKVVVCRYKAPGNVANDMAFLKNVLPKVSVTTTV
ncbi:hypothetical protein VaNZ11_015305 [Volvox africanus]|uniref:SCP domain-containing protein n=1 Tax=Volvox africanus TaxID=51714 RepID=A0ABQ5SL11_9CHLO|nr:hypothetical protein VaNZ11_015305 [Volvox africanus]